MSTLAASGLRCVPVLFLVVGAACGPELTTPAESDVTGTWFAAGPAAGLSDITVVLSQTEDGVVRGTYTATGTPELQFCPSTGPCSISGDLNGSNTVLQVFFYMTDAGTFGGQLEGPGSLKGAMSRISETSPVEFVRVLTPRLISRPLPLTQRD